MHPIAIPKPIAQLWNGNYNTPQAFETIRQQYQHLRKDGSPDVSIVMPAYNEEENIVRTLASLTANKTQFAVEIVVVDNNSKDKTAALVQACGVRCVPETKQGITNARNGGLDAAAGKYILNADADTIYPDEWIERMVLPLHTNNNVALVYGTFSFIPVGSTGRFTYFFYEHFADFTRWLNKYLKDEAVNVYGFNSGFRKEQGYAVEKFNHPLGTNEDGYLALKLRNKGFGKLHQVSHTKALVWTTDRRLQIDGGLYKATWRRIKRVFFGGPR
ncbi:MAG TPA: glycosyl transferase family 2 [Chitinophagaceae bacterium]|nr:glycosyl transferase family 2 [Chitinophagaceae bacterium]HAN40249.1 glycosyl transferase family 2 [Chitinophagaceae bacterium]